MNYSLKMALNKFHKAVWIYNKRVLKINLSIGPSAKTGGNGPSAKTGGSGASSSKPGPTGSSEIDNFVTAAFDLNDKIVELKDKLQGISGDLAESNAVLEAIGNHPEGAIGWAKKELAKGVSSSSNALKGGDIPDSPTKFIANKLGTLKSGVVSASTELQSIPEDLKSIGTQAQSLISSATQLPAAAKSLGMKAPKALKAIKKTTGVLKNIPTEVKSLGDESKKVMEEIDQVLKNIQSILGTA